jgi:hypothetical protein
VAGFEVAGEAVFGGVAEFVEDKRGEEFGDGAVEFRGAEVEECGENGVVVLPACLGIHAARIEAAAHAFVKTGIVEKPADKPADDGQGGGSDAEGDHGEPAALGGFVDENRNRFRRWQWLADGLWQRFCGGAGRGTAAFADPQGFFGVHGMAKSVAAAIASGVA